MKQKPVSTQNDQPKMKIFVRNVNIHAIDTESDNMVNNTVDGLTLKVDSWDYIF